MGAAVINLALVFMVACGVLYYRVGQHEYGSGFVTAGLSVALWMVSAYVLGWSLGASLAVQVGLFGGLTIWNLRRQRRP